MFWKVHGLYFKRSHAFWGFSYFGTPVAFTDGLNTKGLQFLWTLPCWFCIADGASAKFKGFWGLQLCRFGLLKTDLTKACIDTAALVRQRYPGNIRITVVKLNMMFVAGLKGKQGMRFPFFTKHPNRSWTRKNRQRFHWGHPTPSQGFQLQNGVAEWRTIPVSCPSAAFLVAPLAPCNRFSPTTSPGQVHPPHSRFGMVSLPCRPEGAMR